jgi:hypothetical protein
MIRTSLRRIHRINNNHWEGPLKRKLKLTQEKRVYNRLGRRENCPCNEPTTTTHLRPFLQESYIFDYGLHFTSNRRPS